MTDEQRWKLLRALLGHVQDGSAATVTISQDDATEDWCVRVGKRTFISRSLETALRLATGQPV